MNKEDEALSKTRGFLEVLQAHVDGKQVFCRRINCGDHRWYEIDKMWFFWDFTSFEYKFN